MSIPWWSWLVLGLILVGLEMASAGGFFVIFFGIGAFVIAFLQLLGLGGPLWVQLLLFTVLSLVFLVFFRNAVLHWLGYDKPGADVDPLVGETAIPLEDIAPAAVGRAELRGAVWSARNSSQAPLTRGQRCRVVRVERLLIFLEPEGAR